ncbi:MAG: hypothetical protein U9Q07_13715 [Planctomycetota bacterium]|nr:hypothetical protein [Planctomycetota bacterium]
MKQTGMCGFVTIAVFCVLFFTAGCTELSEDAARTEVEHRKTATTESEVKRTTETKEQRPFVKLALRFTPEDSTTYRVVLENDKSVQWEGGESKPRGFQGGHTGNKMEMTFAQQIQSVDDQGHATARITVKTLKYLSKIKDNVTLDFDSSREKDRNSPLSKLIGQSYTIEITPAGQVSKVSDTSAALAAVKGDSPANNVAVMLLSADAIREQHTIPALPATGKEQLRQGDNWSILKNVSFEMMGAKSYEKVYSLKEIKDVGNRRIAIAEMEALPSAENAKQLHKEQTTDFFSQMSDNTQTYIGKLRLDLTEGKVEECNEKLLVEWFIVDPNPKPDELPAALRMAATRLYSIEKID